MTEEKYNTKDIRHINEKSQEYIAKGNIMTEEIIPTNGRSAEDVAYAKKVKEIYIDGVDVSDCRLRQYNSDLCNGFKMDNSGFHQGHCRQNPNCYYKQLKRLEFENKELKDNLKSQQMINLKQQEIALDYWNALEEILESAKFAQCLPCGSGNLEDCLNCDDDTTNNGQFCMEKRIHEIKTKCVEVLSINS